MIEAQAGGRPGGGFDLFASGDCFAERGWRDASPSEAYRLFGKLGATGFDGTGFDGTGFDGTGFDGTSFDGTGFDGTGNFVARPFADPVIDGERPLLGSTVYAPGAPRWVQVGAKLRF